MNLTKFPIVINTTHSGSATGIYFYSGTCPNGYVAAVEYTRSTGSQVPSTAVISIYVGSTVRSIISKTVTTDSWLVCPRKGAVDSTASLIGNTTDYGLCMMPLTGTDLLVAGIVGGTSAATTGLLSVYVEGR